MSNTPPTAAELFAAIQAKLTGVKHDAKNEFHRYTYATTESIIAALKPVLAEERAVFWCEGDEIIESLGPIPVPALRAKYVLTVRDGSEFRCSIEVPFEQSKGRPWDKAKFAALTESHGYAARGMFNLPRGDAADVSGRDDSGARESTTKRRKSGGPVSGKSGSGPKSSGAEGGGAHKGEGPGKAEVTAIYAELQSRLGKINANKLWAEAVGNLKGLKPNDSAWGEAHRKAAQLTQGVERWSKVVGMQQDVQELTGVTQAILEVDAANKPETLKFHEERLTKQLEEIRG